MRQLLASNPKLQAARNIVNLAVNQQQLLNQNFFLSQIGANSNDQQTYRQLLSPREDQQLEIARQQYIRNQLLEYKGHYLTQGDLLSDRSVPSNQHLNNSLDVKDDVEDEKNFVSFENNESKILSFFATNDATEEKQALNFKSETELPSLFTENGRISLIRNLDSSRRNVPVADVQNTNDEPSLVKLPAVHTLARSVYLYFRLLKI